MRNTFIEKLQAFNLYLEEGIEGMRETYPEYEEFVLENKDVSYSELKEQLIKEQNKNGTF